MSEAAPAAPFLSLRSIRKSFGGVRALDDVSIDVRPGEVHCLAGENGSGKSTLIKIIAGVHRPDGGAVEVAGRSYPALTPMESVALGIQVIYQDLSLFPNLTVAENLALNTLIEHRRRVVRWGDVRRTAERAIAHLGVTLDLDRLVGDLPIAGKQLVAIARALVRDARLIILDEPTTALTDVEVATLFGLVRGMATRGVAVVFVSHKMREMRQASDRFTVLRNGRVVESDIASSFDENRLARAMTGRAVGGTRFTDRRADHAAPVLRVSNLSGPILRDVSFDVRPGEILGLTGLLGAGQGELALRLAGFAAGGAGEIAIGGVTIRPYSQRAARRAGIGYVPEDRLSEGLFLDRSVALNTNASSLRRLTRRGFLSRRNARRQVSEWIRTLGIKAASPDVPVRQLSGGNQQRVVLARVLSTRPKVVVLNGPTVGVDIGAKEDIHLTIRRLADEGLGVVMVSDDLGELAGNTSRVLVLQRGAVAAELSGDALTEDRLRDRLTASSSGVTA